MLPKASLRGRVQSAAETTEDGQKHEFRGVLVASTLLMIAGWLGLAQLVTMTRPRIGGELWLFFIFLQMAITGTAIPIVHFICQRFISVDAQAPPPGTVVRRGVWIGMFVVACAWLLIPRALSPLLAFVLVLLFVAIEVFLRNRELANER